MEAPEGSGGGTFGGGVCFGLVPEVDGFGDDRGLLVAGETLVSGLGGGAGGAAGGAVLAGVIGVLVGSRGCNLGTVVQLY